MFCFIVVNMLLYEPMSMLTPPAHRAVVTRVTTQVV